MSYTMKLEAVKQKYFKECVYVVLKPVGTGSYRFLKAVLSVSILIQIIYFIQNQRRKYCKLVSEVYDLVFMYYLFPVLNVAVKGRLVNKLTAAIEEAQKTRHILAENVKDCLVKASAGHVVCRECVRNLCEKR